MNIETSGWSRDFRIIHNGLPLLEVDYPHWYSRKAVFRLEDMSFEVNFRHIFSNRVVLYDSQRNEICTTKMNWRGKTILLFSSQTNLYEFKLVPDGLLARLFYLKHPDGHNLLSVKRRFVLSK